MANIDSIQFLQTMFQKFSWLHYIEQRDKILGSNRINFTVHKHYLKIISLNDMFCKHIIDNRCKKDEAS